MISLIITLVVIGVLLWGINTYIPMQPGIKKIMNIVIVVITILWLLNGFGVMGNIDMPGCHTIR